MKGKPIQMLTASLYAQLTQSFCFSYDGVFMYFWYWESLAVIRRYSLHYWKETGIVFQSPKVPSKSNSYFLRSCSNFFWWSALRCLQSSLTTDWRSALLYLASRICFARWVVSCVLVVGHLELYRTHVLLYSTYVLLARPTKVRR